MRLMITSIAENRVWRALSGRLVVFSTSESSWLRNRGKRCGTPNENSNSSVLTCAMSGDGKQLKLRAMR